MTEKQPEPRPAAAARTVEDRVARMAGEPVTRPDPLVPLSTRIPETLRKRVKMAALDHDREVQSVVTEALETWLARHERRRNP